MNRNFSYVKMETIWNHFVDFSLTFLEHIRPLFNTAVDKSDEFILSILLLALGWWIGTTVQGLIIRLGNRPFIQKITERSGFSSLLQQAEIKSSPSRIVGQFLKGYIFTLFILSVAKILGIHAIADFLESIITYIPNIVVALVIVLFGVHVADTAAAVIKSGFRIAQSSSGKILALVAKGIIVTFAILAALSQLKIAEDLIHVLFIGFVSMVTLSGGLAFGLGGKKIVEDFLNDLKENAKDTDKKS